jgi:hypothetical protein
MGPGIASGRYPETVTVLKHKAGFLRGLQKPGLLKVAFKAFSPDPGGEDRG